jgi:hypothetical protein
MKELNSNPEYSLISPTPRLEWLTETEGMVISEAESDRNVKLIQRAEVHCFDALASTWECETLRFWESIDTDDLFLWLQEDHPQLAADIMNAGLEELGDRLMCLVRLMRVVETHVAGMDPSITTHILSQAQADQLATVLTHMEGSKYSLAFYDEEQSDYEE